MDPNEVLNPEDVKELTPLYEAVVLALKQVYDPEIPVNVYDLGLIYELHINKEHEVSIKMTFTAPNCPMADVVIDEVKHSVENTPGVAKCDIELVSVLTPRFDAERLGFKLVGSPRHADIVVVTGPVTKQSLPRVLRAISQVPEPRCIVTMGSCPQSGNVFRGSYAIAGPLSKYVHVDVDVAGCTPKPEAVIDGLVLATKILQEKRGQKE